MEHSPDVSVIIVNWNTRDLLLDAIQSLLDTTHRTSIEIIVVDNASHDGSQEALRSTFPEVTLIQNADNLGFSKANNIGFTRATGRALCLVNTDIIALDGVIDTLWEFLQQNPDVGMVGPRTLDDHGGRTRQNSRQFPTLLNALGDHLWLKKTGIPVLRGRALPMAQYDHIHEAEVLSGCFLMVRRSTLEDIGPLDEDFFFYGEDTDWGRRCHDAGWRSVYCPEAIAIHFGGGSSAAHRVRYYLAMERADLLYWQKHHSRTNQALYVAIRLVHNILSVIGWSIIWLLQPSNREQARMKVQGNCINTIWLVTRRSLV